MTFFDYRQLLYPLRDRWTPTWKSEKASFEYASFFPVSEPATIAQVGSHSLKIIDQIAGELGTPYGIKSYKPYHSSDEDFLESKDVIITSGLLNTLQDRGIKNLVNLEYTSRKALVNEFMINRKIIKGQEDILIPQIQYNTNDSWVMISGMDSGLGWPLLHQASYGNGKLYLLTIPENFADLYNLPTDVLNSIREILCLQLGIGLQGGSKISLFLYDNNTFVVESFNDVPGEVKIVLSEKAESIMDLSTGKELVMETIPEVRRWGGSLSTPEKYAYKIYLPTHSFRAFKIQ